MHRNVATSATYLGVVLTGVGTTGLLAGSGSGDGLNGTLENVAELEGLNEVTIGAKI